MTIEWESELAALLNDLMSVQDELLAFLADKRQMLLEMDVARLDELEPAGEQLIARLQTLPRPPRRIARRELPARVARPIACDAGKVAASCPAPAASKVASSEAAKRARLLQHQSFANWVFVQRSLIHLARLLEIIATGGRTEPTYGREENCAPADRW